MQQTLDPGRHYPPGVDPTRLPIGPESWSSISIPANFENPPRASPGGDYVARQVASSENLAPPMTTLTQITHLSPAPRVKKQLTRQNLAQLERQQQQQQRQEGSGAGGGGKVSNATDVRMELFLSHELAKTGPLHQQAQTLASPVRPQRSQNGQRSGYAERADDGDAAGNDRYDKVGELRNGLAPHSQNNPPRHQMPTSSGLKKNGVAISSPALSCRTPNPLQQQHNQNDYESILFVAKDGTIIAESRNAIHKLPAGIGAARSNPALSTGLSASRPSITGSSKSVKMIRTCSPQQLTEQEQLVASNSKTATGQRSRQELMTAGSESRLALAGPNVWQQLQAVFLILLKQSRRRKIIYPTLSEITDLIFPLLGVNMFQEEG